MNWTNVAHIREAVALKPLGSGEPVFPSHIVGSFEWARHMSLQGWELEENDGEWYEAVPYHDYGYAWRVAPGSTQGKPLPSDFFDDDDYSFDEDDDEADEDD